MDAPSEHAITLLQALSEAVSRLDLFGYDLFLKRRAPSRGPCRTITTSGHSLKIQGEEFERGYFVCCSLAIDPKKQWSVVFGVTLAWNHEGWFVQATTEEEDERRENLTRSLWESPAYRTHSLAEVVTALSKAIDALVQSVNEPAVAEVLDAIEKR